MIAKVLNTKIKNNFLISSIYTVASFDLINKFLKGLLTILLIRTLTINEYSQYTFFITISTFIFSFFSNGLYTTYTLVESERVSREGYCSIKLFKNNLFIISSINILLFSIITFLSFKEHIDRIILLGVIYSFTISILELVKSYYLVNKKFKNSGKIVNDINIIIAISLMILVIFNKLSLSYVIIFHIFVTGLFAVVHLLKILNLMKNEKLKSYEEKIDFKDYYKASLWIMSYTALLAIFNQMDVFIIKKYLDNESLAMYGVSFKYYNLMLSLLPAIKTVLKIRTTQKDMLDNLKIQKKFIATWIKKTSIVVIPSIIIVILVTPYVFNILNGKQYSNAIAPFQIFCIGVAISYIFSPSSNVIMSMKKYKFITILAFIVCILNLVGNIILVNSIGIIGVVLMTIISHAVINLTSTYYVLKI